MPETQHDKAPVFAGYLLEPLYEGSPNWVVSGYDRDDYESTIFTVNSEGAARSHLYKITGDPAWLAQSGKTERRLLREFNVLEQLQREMDRARESIVTARESQNEDPTDLEWPGIEEGSIDWLRSLMEVARAGGLDVSAYEAAITGTPEDSGDDESDDAEADADPADVDVAALAHPGESLIAAGTRFMFLRIPCVDSGSFVSRMAQRQPSMVMILASGSEITFTATKTRIIPRTTPTRPTTWVTGPKTNSRLRQSARRSRPVCGKSIRHSFPENREDPPNGGFFLVRAPKIPNVRLPCHTLRLKCEVSRPRTQQ
jgi:hypothetical protein